MNKVALLIIPAILISGCDLFKSTSAGQETPSADLSDKAAVNQELLAAAYAGSTERVTLALKRGGDPNFSANDWTPLMYAVSINNEALVSILLTSGAKADWTNSKGLSAVTLAKSKNYEKILALLGPGAGPSTSTTEASTANPSQANRDTTLLGYDVSLTYEDFSNKFKKDVSCKKDTFSDSKIGEYSVPIMVCDIQGEKGVVRFANNSGHWEIYFFEMTTATDNTVKLRLAGEKLEEKSGNKSTITTYSDDIGMSILCGAQVDFYKGQATALSGNIFNKVMEHYNNGDRSAKCTDDIFIDTDLAAIRYENNDLVEKMRSQLINQRDQAERKQAGDIKL